MTEDEMVGWHPSLNGHEFEQTPGDGEGQGNMVCCSPWSHKESDMTEQLNWTDDSLPAFLRTYSVPDTSKFFAGIISFNPYGNLIS